MGWEEVELKTKWRAGPPKKMIIRVKDNGLVHLVNKSFLRKNMEHYAKVMIDEKQCLIGLFSSKTKDNAVSITSALIPITDAVEKLGWNLIKESEYELETEWKDSKKALILRMRTAKRKK